jgi:hypothetical protein
VTIRIWYVCLSSHDCAESKQKFYETTSVKIFETLEYVEPKIDNASARGSQAYDHSNDKAALEICALLGFYTEQNSSFLETLRDNLSVPSSTVR